MDIKPLGELVKMLENSSLTHLEYQDEKIRLVLKKETVTAAAAIVQTPSAQKEKPRISAQTTAVQAENEVLVSSPIVGTIYSAKEQGQQPLVLPGQKVKAGDVLCLIEAMKMFSEVKATCAGVVKEIFFENGQMAEFNMPLLLLVKSS